MIRALVRAGHELARVRLLLSALVAFVGPCVCVFATLCVCVFYVLGRVFSSGGPTITITTTTTPFSVANARREAPVPTRDTHILAGTQKRRPKHKCCGKQMRLKTIQNIFCASGIISTNKKRTSARCDKYHFWLRRVYHI